MFKIFNFRNSKVFRYFSSSTSENVSKVSRQELLLKDFIESSSTIVPNQLNDIKEQILKAGFHINKDNFPATFIHLCLPDRKLDLAKSYFQYLKSDLKLKPNNATLAKLLRLYYIYYGEYTELPQEVQNEIYELCESFQKRASMLDSVSSESAILALSLTSNWKKCLEYLDYIRFTSVPTYASYSTIVGAAFKNGDVEFGWNMLKMMLDDTRIPTQAMYTGISLYLKQNPNSYKQILNKLFEVLNENYIKPTEKFITDITANNSNGKPTTISIKGECKNCNKMLSAFELTESEFELLKQAFYQNVIIGKNLFTKTTPAELEKFNNFVRGSGKYDIVIDGLNVAYSAGVTNISDFRQSQLVADVVKHFVDQNKKVLVIGRVHMQRWKNKHMTYILKNAPLFLAQNLSQDDPFLLYATMSNGPKTSFISRDLMRGHAHKLGDPKLKQLFYRWQHNIQYTYSISDSKEKVDIKNPLPYLPIVQKSKDYWHIPVDIDVETIKWTCLKV